MSKFWASSSSDDGSDDNDNIDSSSDGAEPTKSKILGSSSSSSSDDDKDSDDRSNFDDGSVAGGLITTTQAFPGNDHPQPRNTSLAASSQRDISMTFPTTPPRQPILPVDDPTEAWRRIHSCQVFASPLIRTGRGGVDRPYSPCTRIVCISDTHGYHRSIPIPPCDILIHGGDFSNYGEPDMIADVSDHFSELRQNGTVKDGIICIAGNHELTFELERYDKVWRRFKRPKQDEKYDAESARKALTNCTYLEDESLTLQGIQFYGSPWQPEFYGWAYNAPRSDILSKWERIPSDTDVLITHGPPLGRGDVTKGNRVGCVSLMKEVQSRVKPRLHVFGHIHEGRGVTHDGTTMYVNASNVSHNYTRQHPGIVVDLPHDADMPARLVEPECRLDSDELISWLRRKGFLGTAARFAELEDRLRGSDVVDCSHEDLCCRLLIHRDEEAKAELKQAMTKLW
eukprot:CAMPEP_0196155020 /NCGR_PEP_ID=MMETSP0910-20130528/39942_1 /TAXON_ID=49265 /ORGANISM="Thalassiosira rotula, Strain GSO102" /LENGTH=454 /DNA_ID=CAMNT_0041419161 /DNA_START=95 /DNA_END=1456 /DNA_ORIENTATION=-